MIKETGGKVSADLSVTAGKVFSGIIAVYLCVILAAFPLYYENYYFNILVAKYRFYWISAVALLVLCLAAAVVLACVDQKRYGGENRKRLLASLRPASLRKQPLAYKALAVFWVFAALSTVLSDYVYESFWGNEGRFSGLFLITLYALSVVLIGKLGRIRKWHLDVFLASSVLVCLFGITDYFRMDILGWKSMVVGQQVDAFTSTLGNINTYTAFVALTLGVSCSLFLMEKNVFRLLWYYAVTIVGLFAIITGQSDNAYLALGVLFAFMPFVAFRSFGGAARYTVLVASLMSVMQAIDALNTARADEVIGLTGIFKILVTYENLEVIVIALWVAAAVLYGLKWAAGRREGGDALGKWPRIAWLCAMILAAAAVLYVLYDANFGDNPERYAPIARYVIFNDAWGTSRGYCWRIGWESYEKLPLMHKLFGFGPDTFGILTWDYREEALNTYGVFFESAHNEYLQYLVTMGPFAVLAYVLFLGASCFRMFRETVRTPWILAPALAVLCYGAQAIVNINLPIATPVMWTLLAMGLAMARESRAAAGKDAAGDFERLQELAREEFKKVQ